MTNSLLHVTIQGTGVAVRKQENSSCIVKITILTLAFLFAGTCCYPNSEEYGCHSESL